MLHRIREPFGRAGLIIAVVALVASLVGGAYAASTLTGKQKREVRKIAKKFAGRDGVQGPAGQAGSQGPKGKSGAAGDAGASGKDGEDGKDGKDGKSGESVTIVPLSPGEDPKCPNGGTKFANHQVFSYACNGGGGGGGEYPETLPSGRTMTGYWEVLGDGAFHFGPGNWALTSISFPLPLAAPPAETVLIPVSGGTEDQVAKCPGTSSNPQATAGVLCIYAEFATSLTLLASLPNTFGAQLAFNENDEALGSWAVEAP